MAGGSSRGGPSHGDSSHESDSSHKEPHDNSSHEESHEKSTQPSEKDKGAAADESLKGDDKGAENKKDAAGAAGMAIREEETPMGGDRSKPTPGHTPKRLERPIDGSCINEYRRNDEVTAEGFMFKKRVLFFCFWHEKYFVLKRDGTLVYHKCDGARYPKGNWDVKQATNIRKVDTPNGWHPFRLVFNVNGSERYFGYDNQEDRDFWFERFDEVSKGEGAQADQ